jgi:hypothetical protein
LRALDLWYARLDVEDLAKQWAAQATAKPRKRFDGNVAKARSKDSIRAFDRLTHLVDGHPRIISDPPLIVAIEELVSADDRAVLEDTLRKVIRSYRRTLTGDRRHLLERFRYLGSGDSFDRAMASFAETYADQNDADSAALRHAVDAGRIAVETGL